MTEDIRDDEPEDYRDEPATDLGALDPTKPDLAFARRLKAIRVAAAPALRRRRTGTPLTVVAHWRFPLMAALFLLMIFSALMLRSVASDTGMDITNSDEVADALGVSAVLGDGSDAPTSSTDILLGGYEQ